MIIIDCYFRYHTIRDAVLIFVFFLQLADVFFADLPRIRLDRRIDRPRSRKTIWEPQPNIIEEENEDESAFNSSNLDLNATLHQIELGELLHKSMHKKISKDYWGNHLSIDWNQSSSRNAPWRWIHVHIFLYHWVLIYNFQPIGIGARFKLTSHVIEIWKPLSVYKNFGLKTIVKIV